MMKKITAIISAVFVLAFAIPQAFAADIKTEYNARVDYSSGTQGANGWRYQYMSINGNYESYIDLTWNGTKYVFANSSGSIVNNISNGVIQPGPWKKNSAFVWQAPLNGTVELTCEGNVRKQNAGASTKALIVKTDSKSQNAETLWQRDIDGQDKVGTGNTYEISVDVKKDDIIYFEIQCDSNAAAETAWIPVVTYKQTALFTQGENQITKPADITDNADINCTLYDTLSIDGNSYVYMAVFDNEGYMRAISAPYNIEYQNWTDGRAEMSLNANFGTEDFSGWSIKLFAVTDEASRRYPYSLSDLLYIK